MHIPDGFVSGPVNAITGAMALAACAIAVARTRASLGERQVPLLGVTAAFIFAAQMLNFPIAGGTSGHFLGATFAAILLGPWAACLVMALVLVVQCLLFADGGITALGSNIVNMGMVGVLAGAAIVWLARVALPRTRGIALGAVGIAAWVSVMAAATACALELGLSGKPLGAILPAMLGVHALIGVGEALITVAVASTVMAARPELLAGLAAPRPQPALAKA